MIDAVKSQYAQARELQHLINKGGVHFANEAKTVLKEKGFSSPLFYVLAINQAVSLSGIDYSVQDAFPLVSTIIGVDEVIENNTDLTTQLPELLLKHASSVYNADLPDDVQTLLKEMMAPMYSERAYFEQTAQNGNLPTEFLDCYTRSARRGHRGIFNDSRQLVTFPQELNEGLQTPDSFADYLAMVSNSFGMLPIYRQIANATNEDAYTPDTVENLRKIESATRVLADIITLGKDRSHGSLNVVLENIRYDTSLSIEQSVELLRSMVNTTLAEVALSYASFDDMPKSMQFAFSFAQTLQIVDHQHPELSSNSEDSDLKLQTMLLEALGTIIKIQQVIN